MQRNIDQLIDKLGTMFNVLSGYAQDGNQFQATRAAEVEFQKFRAEYRNPDNWISQDGRVNRITDMTDEHLGNVIRLLDRQADDPKANFQAYEIERYGRLRKEAFRRQVKRLTIPEAE